MTSKQLTARAIISTVASLAQATDTAAALTAEYFDQGTFTDEELAEVEITTATLTDCVTLLQQVDNLMTAQATTPATYRATLNKVRRLAQI